MIRLRNIMSGIELLAIGFEHDCKADEYFRETREVKIVYKGIGDMEYGFQNVFIRGKMPFHYWIDEDQVKPVQVRE